MTPADKLCQKRHFVPHILLAQFPVRSDRSRLFYPSKTRLPRRKVAIGAPISPWVVRWGRPQGGV